MILVKTGAVPLLAVEVDGGMYSECFKKIVGYENVRQNIKGMFTFYHCAYLTFECSLNHETIIISECSLDV